MFKSSCPLADVKLSQLQNMYFGESNKLVDAMFSLAELLAPSIIFIDEVDSLLGIRHRSSHEANDQMKAEFLAHWDGLLTSQSTDVMVIGATNRVYEIDDAALRRFSRSFYIGLPDQQSRLTILTHILSAEELELTPVRLRGLDFAYYVYFRLEIFPCFCCRTSLTHWPQVAKVIPDRI